VKREVQRLRADDKNETLLYAALREVLGTGAGFLPADIDLQSTDCIRNVLAHSGKEFIDLMVSRGLRLLGAADCETDLEARAKRAIRRALILEHDRALISDAFADQGIDTLFFKGALSDSLWWGAQGIRGATDIDVLIPRSAENGAASILINMGYERRRTPTHPATEDAAKEKLFHHPDS
jgi:hypothetical protein